jgi:transcriptional regulator with XRE-family HTH domain
MNIPKRPLINEALRLARLYWGFSQVDMSERLNVSQSTVSEIEKGKKPVSLKLLEKYSKALNVKMSKLMFFAEELEGNLPPTRGKLIIASSVLRILDELSPKE